MSILGSLLGGGSNRPEPSQTMQSNAGGLMSKFNPFNLVSGMFGGRKAGAADNYAKTSGGMRKGLKESKKKDPKFVSKTPRGDMPIQKGESVTDIAAKLYGLIRRNDEKRKKELQIEQNFAKSFNEIKEKRNQELIAALTGQPKDLKKETKKLRKDSDKIKKETQDIKKQGPSKPSEPAPTIPTPAAPKGTPPTAVTPKGTPPAAGAKPPTATPAIPPAPPASAAISSAQTAATATRIFPSLALGTIAAGVAGKIAARESAGESIESYYTMNIWRTKDKSKPQDTASSYLVKKGNLNVVTGKPYEKDLTEMNLGEVIELARSRAKYFKSSGAGAASGKYQFMPDTLKSLAQQKLGTGWEKEIFTPEMQEYLMGSIMNNYSKALVAAGVPVTPASLYMMHFTGSAEKTKKIIYSPDNTSMASILGPAGTRANPSVANQTTKQYKQSIAKKGLDFETLDPKEFSQPKRPVQNVSFNMSTGSTLAEKSQELKDSKQQIASGSRPIILNNNSNVIASSSSIQTMVQPKSDASGFIEGVRV